MLTVSNTDLLPAMPDTITVERFTGKDDHGNPLYAPPTAVRANVAVTVTRGDPGPSAATEPGPVSIQGTVICLPMGITVRDRISLPFVTEKVYADSVSIHPDPTKPGDVWVEELTFGEER